MLSSTDILFEDEDLIAWNKPSMMPTHATLDPQRINLFSAALKFMQERAEARAEDAVQIYLGLHHRLDLETSGVVLMTKSKRANPEIQSLFRSGKIDKCYRGIAAAIGEDTKILADKFMVENFLKRKSKKDARMEVVRAGGDYSKTEFTVLSRSRHAQNWQTDAISIQAQPATGRTHQIRAHLAAVGWPLVADSLYGGRTDTWIPHFLLHAQSLSFAHPFTGAEIKITAELPPPFKKSLMQNGL